MGNLVARVQAIGGVEGAAVLADRIFARGSDGSRVVGLGLAQKDPHRQHLGMVVQGIGQARSAFEQYIALNLADAIAPALPPEGAAQLRDAIASQLDKSIDHNDMSRFRIATRLAKQIGPVAAIEPRSSSGVEDFRIGGQSYAVVAMMPPSHVLLSDAAETHGQWVGTRGTHALALPGTVRVGQCLVTNALYKQFVDAGGYADDPFWTVGKPRRRSFLTSDAVSEGPRGWPSASRVPPGEDDHPVSSVSFLEATAFAAWCNSIATLGADLRWSLVPEDVWEFAARSEDGFVYPWGDAFDPARCNSAESQIGRTTPVRRYDAGVSRCGCYDVAGNVWEYVVPGGDDVNSCVLRGGSFTNDRFEVRSYLRLFGVPQTHRAADFGFRLALVSAS